MFDLGRGDLLYLGGFYMTAQYAPVSRILITTQYNNSKRIDWYAQKEEAVSPVWPCSKTIPRRNGEIRFSDDQQNYYLEARKCDGAFFLFRYVAVGSQLPCGWRNVQSVLHLYGVSARLAIHHTVHRRLRISIHFPDYWGIRKIVSSSSNIFRSETKKAEAAPAPAADGGGVVVVGREEVEHWTTSCYSAD
uniref:Uncharacterized protein n=1 Tax=Vespula pensylvanica TaxID=30213 RepID=A0A834UF14_VESPE|nr:hypothetical protein H0235_003212 [Vespula pensylvanica]